MLTFDDALHLGCVSPEVALRIFDALPPLDTTALRGTWRGAEFPTGHPMDGLLSATGWYGKAFHDDESVHPLLFRGAHAEDIFPIDPARVPFSVRVPRHLPYRALITAARPLLQTPRYTARLRMTLYRGRVSATMIYDRQPIHDVFRRVNDRTVLGAMDARGFAAPYFFVLRQERP
ncbi:DUF4334 domain-containing protein [Deinococcus maricopensis]|uniref:DUF4334 domain-containing protein n=1 Tax=Deinococcus maricopensis (strain DSM 21211 / LMG 22137 / NRRL B-23946 / LB-34) TaxID=709986 RepID=E8U2Z8_DEIML|nr:DUF4334 domain-containing protein [Deinococcus maricopensis]ADV65736.1 hypothetical protein Deima_0072 [Deinococcus maricopensis DSM 21211]